MLASEIKEMAQHAKEASSDLREMTSEEINRLLAEVIKGLEKSGDSIISANLQDIQAAKQKKLPQERINKMLLPPGGGVSRWVQSIQKLIDLPDPVGIKFDQRKLDNGLKVFKQTLPLGCIGAIFESRPHLAILLSCLAIKSRNSIVLRGSKEVLRTNSALIQIIRQALYRCTAPLSSVQLVTRVDNESLLEMLKLQGVLDAIVVRGNHSLQTFCQTHASLPLIVGGNGICHLFIDRSADLNKAIETVNGAKLLPSISSSSLDTLLLHQAIAPQLLLALLNKMGQAGVSFHLDPKAWQIAQQKRALLSATIQLRQAAEKDWKSESTNGTLGIKIVADLDEAIEHISFYGSHLCDGILTEDQLAANLFTSSLDSSCLYINTPPHLIEGGELGCGCEAALSAGKLHARGPVSLQELTTYQWIIEMSH